MFYLLIAKTHSIFNNTQIEMGNYLRLLVNFNLKLHLPHEKEIFMQV